MARSVILGNGSLTVGLNERGMVHDFYYPYVGLENLNTSRSLHHRIGVWVDDTFSWIDEEPWTSEVTFRCDSLLSEVTIRNEQLGLELYFEDCVDYEMNALLRSIEVRNHGGKKRAVRVFMHQVFEISSSGRADTALYVPEEHYLLDYKGRCSLLIYGQTSDGIPFDQYSVGNYGIEGKEGTFRDAEDGELTNNAVEHGGVDSVLRLATEIAADGKSALHYWIVAADSQQAAEVLHQQILDQGLEHRQKRTTALWEKWLETASHQLSGRLSHTERCMINKSLMVIKAHTDKRGGIIASCDSSIYNYGRDYYSYVWPRDGAYAMWPLIRLGYRDEPRAFFEFCRDILHKDGYLMHKYQPDKAIGSTWHPLVHNRRTELAIQEDETAIVVFMLREYVRATADLEFAKKLYLTLIQPSTNFLASFMDEATSLPHASYDLWEEKFSTSTYTVAITYQALLAGAEFADACEYPDDAVRWRDAAKKIKSNCNVFFDRERGLLRKGFLLKPNGSLEFDNTLDISSLFGAWKFQLYKEDDEYLTDTVRACEDILLDKTPSLGCPRYEHDNYFASDPAYMGNPWFVTTLWLAQYYAAHDQQDKAEKYIEWTVSHSLLSGVLSEQINPTTGEPISVTPLVWSHAELINTILDLKQK